MNDCHTQRISLISTSTGSSDRDNSSSGCGDYSRVVAVIVVSKSVVVVIIVQ